MVIFFSTEFFFYSMIILSVGAPFDFFELFLTTRTFFIDIWDPGSHNM